jgi:hypothetical protein
MSSHSSSRSFFPSSPFYLCLLLVFLLFFLTHFIFLLLSYHSSIALSFFFSPSPFNSLIYPLHPLVVFLLFFITHFIFLLLYYYAHIFPSPLFLLPVSFLFSDLSSSCWLSPILSHPLRIPPSFLSFFYCPLCLLSIFWFILLLHLPHTSVGAETERNSPLLTRFALVSTPVDYLQRRLHHLGRRTKA